MPRLLTLQYHLCHPLSPNPLRNQNDSDNQRHAFCLPPISQPQRLHILVSSNRTVSEYCSVCISRVGLSTKQAAEPYSDNLLNRTWNPSEPYSDKEIPLRRALRRFAFLAGFSLGIHRKLGLSQLGTCEFWDHLCPGFAPNPLLLLLGFLSGLFLVGLLVLFVGGFALLCCSTLHAFNACIISERGGGQDSHPP